MPVLAAVLLGVHFTQGSSSAPAATPTVDPRLVLRAHTVPVTGTLAGTTLHGTLYPGFPGANTIQITAPDLGGMADGASAYIDVVATMPGMRMIPVSARLQAHNGAYSGTLPLPMFGVYTARLTLVHGAEHQHGTAQLSLPLTIGQ